MKRTLAFFAELFAAILALSGCRQGPHFAVALSPDGRLVARTEPETGLYVRPIDSREARLVYRKTNLTAPRFSPDGHQIVVQECPPDETVTGKDFKPVTRHVAPTTWIAEVSGGSPKRLPFRLDPPFAWSPDGKRLIGWSSDKVATTVDVAKVSRTGTVSVAKPESVLWLPDGSYVLALPHSIDLASGGKVRELYNTKLWISSVVCRDGKVYWGELDTISNLTDVTVASVRSLDISTRELSTIRGPTNLAKLLGVQAVIPIGAVAEVDPGAKRMGVAVTTVEGPAGAWRNYIKLCDEVKKHPKSEDAQRRKSGIEAKLIVGYTVAVLDLHSGVLSTLNNTPWVPLVKLGKAGNDVDLFRESAWSDDGKVFAVARADRTDVYPLGLAKG